MAKKKIGRKRELPLNLESIPVRVDREVKEAMREYCHVHRITYTQLVRQLLVEKLRSESYLGK